MPEASPISAVRLPTEVTRARQVKAVRATEISMTPQTLSAMAKTVPAVTVSPRKSRPNTAAWAGSVRE